MPPHTVPRAIKARIPILRYVYKLEVHEICRYLGIRKSCAYTALKYDSRYGVPWNPHARSAGRHRLMTYTHLSFLHNFLIENPCAYLDEMQDALCHKFGIEVKVPTLLAALRELDYTNKCISKEALERDDKRRAIFKYSIGKIARDPNMLLFLDEAAKNERTPGRTRGWSLRGTRVQQRRCFVRGRRYSILPAITLDGIVAREIIDGSVTSERFCRFLRIHVVRPTFPFRLGLEMLNSRVYLMQIPLTNPYPGPRSCIVLDNCAIHHSEEIRKLVEDEAGKHPFEAFITPVPCIHEDSVVESSIGCKLIFLPPYSPDFNPIEFAFSSIKAYLRRHWKDNALSLSTIHHACDNVGPWKAYEWFKACGYCN